MDYTHLTDDELVRRLDVTPNLDPLVLELKARLARALDHLDELVDRVDKLEDQVAGVEGGDDAGGPG